MNNFASSPHTAYSSNNHDFDGKREHTWYLMNRAYQNLYGLSMPGDPHYQQTIFNAALQLIRDHRCTSLSEKFLLQAIEDIIRISDEHHRQAQKHLSRASNPVYLRETALDNIMEHQKYITALEELMPESTVRSWRMEHSGRVEYASPTSGEVVELAVEHLAATLEAQK